MSDWKPEIHRTAPSDLKLHPVYGHQLDVLASESRRATGGAAGLSSSLSIGVSTLLALATCDVNQDWQTPLQAVVVLSGAALAVSVWSCVSGVLKRSRLIKEIRDQPLMEPPSREMDENLEDLLSDRTPDEGPS